MLLVIGVAAVGTLQLGESGAQPRGASAAGSVWVAFLPLLAVEWMLVLWVARIARPANVLSDLVGARWGDARDVLVDLGWAARAAVAIVTLEVAAAHLLGSSRAPSVTAMLPHTAAERAGWVVVAIAVGFCEEVVYRGYLQTQLLAFTRSPWAAVLGSAVAFGVAHLEQGPWAALRIAFAGAVLGYVARARRSLLPGILCHVGIDAAAGLLARQP
ncbi:MAG: CPBP family intramembrane metalloprotease [Deltaproteobacteria bacterium]|nr:CPBP family intramembrane metalloprotease [Deltaproteobacteria bacterium]